MKSDIFEQEEILETEAKFKKGKMPMRDIKVEKHDVLFKDIDCNKKSKEPQAEDEDVGLTLDEILAEEQELKAAQDEGENADKSKKGSKKKGKKGKKKKGKKVVNDEL